MNHLGPGYGSAKFCIISRVILLYKRITSVLSMDGKGQVPQSTHEPKRVPFSSLVCGEDPVGVYKSACLSQTSKDSVNF